MKHAVQQVERLLFSEREAAAALGINVKLLRRWRMLDKGPRYIKLSGKLGQTGGRIAYPVRDLHLWLNSLPSGGEQPKGEAA